MYRGYVKRGQCNELVAIKTGKGSTHTIELLCSTFSVYSPNTIALLAVQDKERLLKEVSLMLTFSHPNVMQLIGLSFDREMPLIIMPFMSKGTVLEYVREHRDSLYITESVDKNQVEQSVGLCELLY